MCIQDKMSVGLSKWVLHQINSIKISNHGWKLVLEVHRTDETKDLVFLRHHGFNEQPLKLTTYVCGDMSYYNTCIPYSTPPIHTNSEKTVASFTHTTDSCTARLQCVETIENVETIKNAETIKNVERTDMLVPINHLQVEYGSVFIRETTDVVITLVEMTHSETNCKKSPITQNTHTIRLTSTWHSTLSASKRQKQLDRLFEALSWFDF